MEHASPLNLSTPSDGAHALCKALESGLPGRPMASRIESLIRSGADPWERVPAWCFAYDRLQPHTSGAPLNVLEHCFEYLQRARGQTIGRWLTVLDGIAAATAHAAVPLDRFIIAPHQPRDVGDTKWRRALGVERLCASMRSRPEIAPAVRAMLEQVVATRLGLVPGRPAPQPGVITIEEIALMGDPLVPDDLLLRYWTTPTYREHPIRRTATIEPTTYPSRVPVWEEVSQASTRQVPHLLRLLGRGRYLAKQSDIDPQIPVRLITRVLARLEAIGVDLTSPASVGLSVHSPLHVATASRARATPLALLSLRLDPDAKGAATMSPADLVGDRTELVQAVSHARACHARAALASRLGLSVAQPARVARPV